MSVWDSYPENYRSAEIHEILTSTQAGECVALIGLSGAGKSNLLGFLIHRITSEVRFVLIDCNHLSAADPSSLLSAILEGLAAPISTPTTLSSVVDTMKTELETSSRKLCLVFDRFELFSLQSESGRVIANNLRALRDNFKYDLTYLLSMRRPLEVENELAELFLAHTLWLGPLTDSDARWSVLQFAARHNLQWKDEIMERIVSLSGGYPSMLRAACEAAAAGTPLEVDALQNSRPVELRLAEFWADAPDEHARKESRLDGLALLIKGARITKLNQELTAAEQRLLEHFVARSGQICSKEELIQAVWPEEKLVAGLRDDSLTQLVHRLREKVDPEGKYLIQTLPGRGYRYKG